MRPLRSTIALVVLLMAAACGGGGGEPTTATTEVTPGPEVATEDLATGEGEATDGATEATDGEAAASGEPFTLGILAPYTGVFASFGPDVIEAPVRLFLEQNDNALAGRPVELVIADTQSTPEAGLEKARELVESENVDAIVGIVNSAGALAVRDYLHESQVPTFITVAGAREITGERMSPYIFRVSFANPQFSAPGAVLAHEVAQIGTIISVGADYVGGHEALDPFIEAYEELGGNVNDVLYAPFPSTDYSSYLSQIQRAAGEIDTVVPLMYGADAVRFFGQYQEFGMTLPLYMYGDVVEQTTVLDQIDGQAIVGSQTYWNYSPYLDNPVNEQFRTEYMEAYDRLPGAFSMHAYSAMQFLQAGLEEVGGDTEDVDALIAALEGVDIDSPSGPLRFDENHQVVWTIYLLEIQEGPDGIVAQMPLGPRVENVGQEATLEEVQQNLVTE